MANCPAYGDAGHKYISTPNGSFQTCEACKDFIYGRGRSQFECKGCRKYFHGFCVGNPPTVTFQFGDANIRTVLSLATPVPNQANNQYPRCQACDCRMRGSWSYRGGDYSLHPECAVNLAPLRNLNADNPESVLNRFLGRHPECADMVVQLSWVLSDGLGKCIICDCFPGAKNYRGFWYSFIRNGQPYSGCHLGCFRELLIENRSSNEMVNFERYYNSLPRGNQTTHEVVLDVLKLAIGLAVPPPYSNLLVFALSVAAAAARR